MALPSDRSVLTIDLAALVANWQQVDRLLGPGRTTSAVVKANAYGTGALRVVPALASAGCQTFFVANLEEAVAVAPVLEPESVLYSLAGAPDPVSAGELVASGVRPVLNSLEQIVLWGAAARKFGKRLPAAIHLDTGMTRLGLAGAAVTRLLQEPRLLDGVEVRHWLTHLACADEPSHPANEAQLGRFELWQQQLCAATLTISAAASGPSTSVGNSALCLSHPERCGQLARPGIALYGGNPFAGPGVTASATAACFVDGAEAPQPVVHWRAPILQLSEVSAGAAVGYGGTYRAPRPVVIATVAAGYADGYRRNLSNAGWATLHGQRVPLVGRVSMDLVTFDVTEVVQSASVVPGDHVSLVGGGVDLDELAGAADTISYELLTGIAPRVAREYCE